MNRVDAQRLQRFDLAQRARRPQLDDIRRAHPRQHHQRGCQRPEFANHHRHHHRAGQVLRAHPRQQSDHLSNDHQPQRARQKTDHRQ